MNNKLIYEGQHWETLTRWYPYQFKNIVPFLGKGWRGLFAEACQQIHVALSSNERRGFHWDAIRESHGKLLLSYAAPIEKDGLITDIINSLEIMSTLVCELNGKTIPYQGQQRHGTH